MRSATPAGDLAGTTRTFCDVRFCAAVRRTADVKPAWSEHSLDSCLVAFSFRKTCVHQPIKRDKRFPENAPATSGDAASRRDAPEVERLEVAEQLEGRPVAQFHAMPIDRDEP